MLLVQQRRNRNKDSTSQADDLSTKQTYFCQEIPPPYNNPYAKSSNSTQTQRNRSYRIPTNQSYKTSPPYPTEQCRFQLPSFRRPGKIHTQIFPLHLLFTPFSLFFVKTKTNAMISGTEPSPSRHSFPPSTRQTRKTVRLRSAIIRAG